MDISGLSVDLYALFRSILGSSTLGHAFRDLSLESAGQGSGVVPLLELAEQLYHRAHYSSAGAEYGLRCFHILRGVLSALVDLDVLVYSGDFGQDARGYGSCVQRYQ